MSQLPPEFFLLDTKHGAYHRRGRKRTLINFPQVLTEGVNDSAVEITVTNGEPGATWVITVSSDGGGTPVTDTGTVPASGSFSTTLDLTGLNAGILTYDYEEDSELVTSRTGLLNTAGAGEPIGLLLALTKAA